MSTMGVVYGVGADVDERSASLRQHINQAADADRHSISTLVVGLALTSFFASACPCVRTLAVVRRERWS